MLHVQMGLDAFLNEVIADSQRAARHESTGWVRVGNSIDANAAAVCASEVDQPVE